MLHIISYSFFLQFCLNLADFQQTFFVPFIAIPLHIYTMALSIMLVFQCFNAEIKNVHLTQRITYSVPNRVLN